MGGGVTSGDWGSSSGGGSGLVCVFCAADDEEPFNDVVSHPLKNSAKRSEAKNAKQGLQYEVFIKSSKSAR
jgi:hypothetical protein